MVPPAPLVGLIAALLLHRSAGISARGRHLLSMRPSRPRNFALLSLHGDEEGFQAASPQDRLQMKLEKLVHVADLAAGKANWPPPGADPWPPRTPEGVAAVGYMSSLEALLLTGAVVLCVGMGIYFHTQARAVGERQKAPVGGASGSAPPLATAAPPRSQMPLVATHFHALASAIVWRHLHTRALVFHLLRVTLPLLALVVMHRARGYLAEQFADSTWQTMLATFGGMTPDEAVDAILDYLLLLTLLYVAVASMIFFVGHLAVESESGFRRLLHISGLSRSAYLTAAAGVDGTLHALLSLSTLALVAAAALRLRVVVWTSPVLLLLVLGTLALAVTLVGYLLHFPFASARAASTAAQVVVMLVLFTAPFAPLIPAIPTAAVGQSWRVLVLPVLPAYSSLFELARACMKGRCLRLHDVASAWRGGHWASAWTMVFGSPEAANPTPPEAVISLLGLVALQLTAGWLLVVLLDVYRHPALHQVAGSAAPGAKEEAALEVRGLVHTYGWLRGTGLPSTEERVLDDVSFAVAPGATLGLLGPNGAGKTTAIRCITGEEAPSEGTVSILPGVTAGSAYIGLCPQETVLSEDLTAEENLLLFAHIRGLRGAHADHCVAQILEATSLGEKRAWLPNTLSGGMRRRLAVACAMVAAPSVAILDEPTTGLDPMNRRGIWGTIGEIKAAGGCCLLTTHMLEEAEALCTNLVILRKGRLAAEGSVQKLKEEWGTGYMLSVDCSPGEEARATSCVASLLPAECQKPVKVSARGQMTFKVSSDAQTVGRLFIALAEAAEASGIRHWGISQASLEDAYLRVIQEETAGP
mmetsp:Transcript_30865/g.98482  ORF Transcript_30865/g.98482 Transcript_30865/m.98482 type:complete len:814 (+) Transcript_30865:109-2550(+)